MTERTVLIADDHPLFRKGLRTLLATLPDTRVVGEAASGGEAVQRPIFAPVMSVLIS